MSKRLREIKETCPIFENIEDEIKSIELTLGPTVTGLIDSNLNKVLELADIIRNTCGDLRETAHDIVESKNKEIEDLRNEMNDEIKYISGLHDKAEDELYYAKERISELESIFSK
jgi:ribosome recycling factor